MAFTMVDIADRFGERGDFCFWKQRMHAILVQLKAAKALKGEKALPDSWSADQQEDVMELAYSPIILHLGDNVMRHVKKLKTVVEVW